MPVDRQAAAADLEQRRVALTVVGIVQGVGFRPFVYNLAAAERVVGWVANQADSVSIEVQGATTAVGRFLERLQSQLPAAAKIEQLTIQEQTPLLVGSCETGFQIRHSTADALPKPTIPADLATCPDCLAEIRQSDQRRYGYAFTNCTGCGPRWSIIQQLPYDRPRTSMRQFQMCPDCQREYDDPTDRRFHAQPIACPACGPRLQLLDATGTPVDGVGDLLQEAVERVLCGEVLALKGLGGFQLIVDATNDDAVQALRTRKRRPAKPFAVMLSDMAAVRAYCQASDVEAETLQQPSAPIVLLRRWSELPGREALSAGSTDEVVAEDGPAASALPLSDGEETGASALPLRGEALEVAPLSSHVAPGNPYLGVMLPYTPLHHLLLDRIGRPTVCTSGNLSEEPMAVTTTEAVERLGEIADVILTHDRPIVRPVDDSIARIGPQGLQIMRRARGFAPRPIRIGRSLPTILAVGGHLKNTVALSLAGDVILSPHIGDLDNALSVDVYRRAIDDLIGFFRVKPEAVACDLHPDYASTRHAERLAAEWNIPLVRVQHHRAHVAACIAENHLFDKRVVGFSWDGTGYGGDGTVWGGEAFSWQTGDQEMRRVAHLRTFPLPGGDRAAGEPRRCALGLLHEGLGADAADRSRQWFQPHELKTLSAALQRPKLFPRTSSMGRLFDAVACLCRLGSQSSFEGQAAMALEFAADSQCDDSYELVVTDGEPSVGDWEPLLRDVLEDLDANVRVSIIATKFHRALADWCVRVANTNDCDCVVLSGGCFQNALLSRLAEERLSEAGISVYTHREVPPGDGGIALGQILLAAEQLKGGLPCA